MMIREANFWLNLNQILIMVDQTWLNIAKIIQMVWNGGLG